MKICFDIDGVLLDFDAAWRLFASEFLDRDVVKLTNQYHLGNRHGLSDEEHAQVWQAFNESGRWRHVEAYDGVADEIAKLHDLGIEISCITATNPEFAEMRKESLRAIGITDQEISFTGHHGAGGGKHDALRAHDPVIYIDDQWFNLLAAKEVDVGVRVWIDQGDEQIMVPSGVQWEEIATHRFTTLGPAIETALALDLPRKREAIRFAAD